MTISNPSSIENNTTLGRDDNKNWNNWEPIWTKDNKTPHDFQERHSPTITQTKGKSKIRVTARIVDIRLWNSMSVEQQNAATNIAASFETLTKGIGYSTMKYEQRISNTSKGTRNISEAQSEIIDFYMKWAESCVKQKISHSIIIDILCFGLSCSASDKIRKVRKGSSKKWLFDGLDVYCKMRGWI